MSKFLSPKNFSAILASLLLTCTSHAQRVACMGDSITEGFMAMPYTDFLQSNLGSDWQILNYGVGGATVTDEDINSYRATDEYSEALGSGAAHVVLKLGTNDGLTARWVSKESFETDYKQIVNTISLMPSQPQIWLVTPLPVINDGDFNIDPNIVNKAVVQVVRSLEGFRGAKVIELNSQFRYDGSLHIEDIHPSSEGASRIAWIIGQQLKNKGAGSPELVRNSIDLGGGWRRISGLGDFSTATYPWIYHEDLRWVYVGRDDPDNLWLWSPAKSFGWLWTTTDLYSEFYRVDTKSFYFFLDSGSEDLVYDYKDEKWEDSPF